MADVPSKKVIDLIRLKAVELEAKFIAERIFGEGTSPETERAGKGLAALLNEKIDG